MSGLTVSHDHPMTQQSHRDYRKPQGGKKRCNELQTELMVEGMMDEEEEPSCLDALTTVILVVLALFLVGGLIAWMVSSNGSGNDDGMYPYMMHSGTINPSQPCGLSFLAAKTTTTALPGGNRPYWF